MRQPRLRVFDITIAGTQCYREQAGNRIAIEVQHDLAQEHKTSVRVVEKYIGGAKRRLTEDNDEAE